VLKKVWPRAALPGVPAWALQWASWAAGEVSAAWAALTSSMEVRLSSRPAAKRVVVVVGMAIVLKRWLKRC
jgi:hypothetical protein